MADLPQPEPSGPAPVELAVADEIDGLALEARPGLSQAALALARVMDNQRAINEHAPAAKVLRTLLDELRSASARVHRGRLAVVRAMATGDE